MIIGDDNDIIDTKIFKCELRKVKKGNRYSL